MNSCFGGLRTWMVSGTFAATPSRSVGSIRKLSRFSSSSGLTTSKRGAVSARSEPRSSEALEISLVLWFISLLFEHRGRCRVAGLSFCDNPPAAKRYAPTSDAHPLSLDFPQNGGRFRDGFAEK